MHTSCSQFWAVVQSPALACEEIGCHQFEQVGILHLLLFLPTTRPQNCLSCYNFYFSCKTDKDLFLKFTVD